MLKAATFHAEGLERKPTSFHASLIQGSRGAAQGSRPLSGCTYCTRCMQAEALTKVGVRVLRGCGGVERGGAVLREALIMLKGEVKLRGRK